MTNDETDTLDQIEKYLRKQATDISRFLHAFNYGDIRYFSIASLKKRKFTSYLSSYEGKFTLIALGVIVLAFTTGISTIGFLKDSTYQNPSLTIYAHSGVWDTIPARQESSKTYHILNTHDGPIVLTLDLIHWNPFSSQNLVEIDWNYDGRVIHPNQSINVIITVKNLEYENPVSIGLDIIVYGIEI